MSERLRLAVAVAMALVLTTLWWAYEPARSAAFIWDDHAMLQGDAPWKEAHLGQLFLQSFWPEGPLMDARPAYYRPLVLLSYRFDEALGGTPVEYHFTNTLLHVTGCGLLFLLCRRLGAQPFAAVLAAFAWGTVPRLTESVAWISGRTDVLAGVFAIAALAVHPSLKERPNARGPRAVALAAFSGFLFFLALCSKEVALAAGAAMLVAPLRRRSGESFWQRDRVLQALVSVAIPLLVYLSLRTLAVTIRPEHVPESRTFVRLLIPFEALARYLEMTMVSWNPHASIGYVGSPHFVRVAVGVVLAAAITVALAWRRGRKRVLPLGVAVGMTCGATALFLVLQVIPFTIHGAVAADRLLYVPLAGLAVALSVAARQLGPRVAHTAAGAALAFALFSAQATRARAAIYQDEFSFWIDAVEHAHPENTSPLSALAGLVRDWGHPREACELFETVRTRLESTGRSGTTLHRRARENYAGCLVSLGRYDDALQEYLSLVSDYGSFGRVHMEFGFALLHVAAVDHAEEEFRKAGELDARLIPYVRPVLGQIPSIRTRAAEFNDFRRREEKPNEYAQYLLSLGRLPEAHRAMLDVVLDERQDQKVREDFAEALIRQGQLDYAERAFNVRCVAQDCWGGLKNHMAARRKRYERIAREVELLHRFAGTEKANRSPRAQGN